MLLLALPFIDLRRERRLSRRPVAVVASILVVISMGVLTYKGATAKESLASENVRSSFRPMGEGRTCRPRPVPGAKLFAQVGCLNCHTLPRRGRPQPRRAGPAAEGAKNKGVAFQIDHLKCPSCVNPGSPMPSFAGLGQDNLKKLAIFLEASKGIKK